MINKLKQKHVIALLGIMVLAFFLNIYNIAQDGWGNEYYAAAVQSMMQSWHNFFFLSFDPAGFVTVDKPPFGFWIQTMFANVFGYKGWVLILPQALAGALSAGMIYLILTKRFSKAVGLMAALFFTLTPIAVAVARNNTIDSLLVFDLLIATWLLFKAIDERKWKWLFIAAFLVGLGFNIKMLQAYMVIPAFLLIFWIGAKVSWKRKIVPTIVAGVIVGCVSFSWAFAVDSVSTEDRPYIGSSEDNTVMELIFGHNGVSRLVGGGGGGQGGQQQGGQGNQMMVPGQGGPNGGQGPSGQGGTSDGQGRFGQDGPNDGQGQADGNGGGMDNETGSESILRLFNQQLSGQISWLIPLILFTCIAIFSKVKSFRLTRKQEMTLFWLSWFVPMAIFFSFAGFFHRYYLVMLAPAIAALAAIGLEQMWKDWKVGETWRKWLLPVAWITTVVYEMSIVWSYESVRSWMIPLTAIIGVAGLVVLFLNTSPQMKKIAAILGISTLLVAPGYWALTPIIYGASSSLPYAGPDLDNDQKGGPSGDSSSALQDYLVENYQEESYLVMAESSHDVSTMIIETGLPAVAYGGFNGGDNILTLEMLQELVEEGKATYIMVSNRLSQDIQDWIRENGELVPESEYSDENTQSMEKSRQQGPGKMGGSSDLYKLN
ncbi:glycosyltransferase family 39 protein [Bacillus carboniphilus]|uniref:Glycosyltransferase family 39 protein n=1 Tax=Bacillus carboniphilus TaxID=86663 RepID=A0ABY9JS50_9BACI|nr:glycosyltransferase family 39 protein [Bacillus carboniphilus]WLR41235.1 glycosyltransferase family 39 protein [Bacillus carboniphilus]